MSQMPPMQPNYAQGPKPAGMAIASMVLGIISLIICFPYTAIPCAIVAIVLGAIAKGKANRDEGGGKGMAMAGLIMGIVSIVLIVLFAILAIVGFTVFGTQMQQAVQKAQQQQQLQMQRQQQMSQPGGTQTTTPADQGPEAPKANP